MTDQKTTETSFHGLFGNPNADKIMAPEVYIASIIEDPNQYDEKKFKAAATLLPYRVPQLNRVDAVNRNVEMSHEEWIKTLEDDPTVEPYTPPEEDD